MDRQESSMTEAKDFAIVMAYEAFRICLGLPTRKHSPADVMRWMRLVLRPTDRGTDAEG